MKYLDEETNDFQIVQKFPLFLVCVVLIIVVKSQYALNIVRHKYRIMYHKI